MRLYSRDEFTGGDDPDIEGRVPDGGGNLDISLGFWARNDATFPTGNTEYFAIVSGDCCHPAPTTGDYRHYTVTTLSISPPQSCQVTARFVSPVQGFGNQWFSPLVMHDQDLETGYELLLADTGAWELDEISASAYTLMRSGTFSFTADTPVVARLCYTEDLHLIATIDGAVVADFNLATDVADETGTIVTIHSIGNPGLCIRDASGDGSLMRIDEWLAAGPDAGNPSDGGGTTQPGPLNVYVFQRGAWRSLTTVDGLRGQARGSIRTASEGWVFARGAWRPCTNTVDVEGDPGAGGNPDVGCVEVTDFLPPTTPDPLFGRFFGMASMPTAILGPLFTATQVATGAWITEAIADAVANSSTIIGAQGGYDKFKTGGVWDRSKYEAWVTGTVVPLLTDLQTATANGSYYGFSMLDDFESDALWGTGGIPTSDISDLVAWLKLNLPGILIGIRGRPTQFASDLGFDFYQAQFVSWRGQTAADFRSTEQSLAISRGAAIILALNFLHGGDGSSGIRVNNGTMLSGHYMMSPTEVEAYFGDLLTDGTNLAGTSGYQYYPAFLQQSGMMAALTASRNLLAAL